MNSHYRVRTPEQVQKKVDKLKTEFMVKKIMDDSETNYLRDLLNRLRRRRKRRQKLIPESNTEAIKIKKLERKLRRINEGKWRQGKTVSQKT